MQPLNPFMRSLAPKTDWIKEVHSYLIVFRNGKHIVIEVIEGKEDQVVEQTYKKTMQFARSVREVKRKEPYSICEPIKEWHFHYVLKDHQNLYLIGCTSGDFVYKNGDASLEDDHSNLLEAKMVYEYLNSRLLNN